MKEQKENNLKERREIETSEKRVNLRETQVSEVCALNITAYSSLARPAGTQGGTREFVVV